MTTADHAAAARSKAYRMTIDLTQAHDLAIEQHMNPITITVIHNALAEACRLHRRLISLVPRLLHEQIKGSEQTP